MGSKVPNSGITLAIGYGFGIFFSLILLIIYYLIGIVGANFLTDPSWLNIKLFIVLSFTVFLSGIPITGGFFVFSLVIQNAPYLANLFAIEMSYWFWGTFILYFFFALGLYVFNTLAQFYIIFIIDYPTPNQKKKNQYYSIIILIVSTIVGLIIIINYEIIFLGVSSFVKEI